MADAKSFCLSGNSSPGIGSILIGVLWEYENDSLFQINFFERNVDRNGDGLFEGGETGLLTLNVPRNQTFEVLFTTTGGTEINLASTDAFFIFTPNGGAELPCNNDSVEVQADLDLVIDSLGQLAAYEVNAIGEFLWFLECPNNDGAAFAYAESTAALDLG